MALPVSVSSPLLNEPLCRSDGEVERVAGMKATDLHRRAGQHIAAVRSAHGERGVDLDRRAAAVKVAVAPAVTTGGSCTRVSTLVATSGTGMFWVAYCLTSA